MDGGFLVWTYHSLPVSPTGSFDPKGTFCARIYPRHFNTNYSSPSLTYNHTLEEMFEWTTVSRVDTILLKVSVLNARLLLLSATADARSSMQCRSDSDLFDDRFLTLLWYKARQFDFVERVSNGDTLLVGEGNLSFSLSLSRKRQIHPRKLIATTFEAEKYLSRETRNNASRLRSGGTTVLHGVDARNLSARIKSARFDNIVFMFPNVASRTPNRGRNPNHRLICRFLMSAALHLKAGSKIIISAVHSPHYLGAFGFEEAAKKTGYQPPDVYRFDPSDFPRYEHVMTHQEENALHNHKKVSLWVFRLK